MSNQPRNVIFRQKLLIFFVDRFRMGQLGKIYNSLDIVLQEIGEENLQSCYSAEEMVKASISKIKIIEE